MLMVTRGRETVPLSSLWLRCCPADAIFLSPFASSDPDGLDRVSQDLKFQDRAVEDAPAKKLPFTLFF